MAIPDRYRVYLTAFRGDGNMASTIQLAPEAEQRIDSLVARTGRSKDFFLKEIIKRGLEDVEDYYLAAEVLERVREGTEAVYSDAEVRRELDHP